MLDIRLYEAMNTKQRNYFRRYMSYYVGLLPQVCGFMSDLSYVLEDELTADCPLIAKIKTVIEDLKNIDWVNFESMLAYEIADIEAMLDVCCEIADVNAELIDYDNCDNYHIKHAVNVYYDMIGNEFYDESFDTV